jgi:hypothetical protein
MLKIIFLACMVFASPSSAEEWTPIGPEMSSAKFAAMGWEQSSSAGLSWPDGRQAVVSYWTVLRDGARVTARCISFFDEDLRSTGDICYTAILVAN